MIQVKKIIPIDKKYVDMSKIYDQTNADSANYPTDKYGMVGAVYGNSLDKFKDAINAQIKDLEAEGNHVIGIGVIGNETPILFIGEDI